MFVKMQFVHLKLFLSLWMSALVTGQMYYRNSYMASYGDRPSNRARNRQGEGDMATSNSHTDFRNYFAQKRSPPSYDDRGQFGTHRDSRGHHAPGDTDGEGSYYQSGHHNRPRPGHRPPRTSTTTVSPVVVDETEAALIKNIEFALGLAETPPEYSRISSMLLTEQCQRLFNSGSPRLRQFCTMLNTGR